LQRRRIIGSRNITESTSNNSLSLRKKSPFTEDHGVHAAQYRNVWLWRDWPGRAGKKDNGIDLVAERQDGGFTAIQCKHPTTQTS